MDDKEILRLIEKLQSKTISPEELKKLRALLHTTNDSKALLGLMREMYEEVSVASDDVTYKNEEKTRKRLIQRIQKDNSVTRKRNILYYWVAGIAAVGLLSLGFLFLLQKQESTPALKWVMVSTQHGERKKITLSDGSTIQLNGNTKLSYLKKNSIPIRLVKLDGEAFFDITKDESKPFLVVSKKFTTQVVGTSFNIDTDIGKTVEVNSGKVNVYATSDSQALKLTSDGSAEKKNDMLSILEKTTRGKVSLLPGEKAHLNDSNKWEVSAYHHKNWLDNELVFLNEPLPRVLKKAYRNYGDSIAIDSAFANTNMTITFKGKKIEQVLNTLVELSNGKLTRDPTTKIWKISKIDN